MKEREYTEEEKRLLMAARPACSRPECADLQRRLEQAQETIDAMRREGCAATTLQQDLLEEIAAYWQRHGFSPSIRELVEKTGTPSTSTVTRRVRSLRAAGLLTFWATIPRSIVLTDAGWRLSGQKRPCCS